jgi:ABC-type antimicrobial peptide transport system permease subunit
MAALRAVLKKGKTGPQRHTVLPYEDVLASPATLRRGIFVVRLVGILGGVCLMLAFLGIASATAELVRRNWRELGIRAALGASPGALVFLVLRRAAMLVGAGTLLGVPPVVVHNAVYPPRDMTATMLLLRPEAWLVVAGAGATILVTSWLLARHAGRAEPASLLREE